MFFEQFKNVAVFDGAMGTMLQNAGMPAGSLPEMMNFTSSSTVSRIHSEYIAAGADIISSNSFGANKAKLSPFGIDAYDAVFTAVTLARRAAEKADRRVFVCADLGPTGKLMPPLGDFSFEEAVSAFKDSVIAAERAGADFIFFETFSDLYECKAALIAARENTSLPVAVSLTFDENGRTLTGADVLTAAVYLSGIGADAVGVNCGLGPDLMEKVAVELAKESGLPVIVNANAGLPKLSPDGKTEFDVPPSRFHSFAKTLAENGIFAVGGCCGTTPEYIRSVSSALNGVARTVLPIPERNAVCSGSRTFIFGEKTAVIGERLNPTGKPKLKEALRTGNPDYLRSEAVLQQANGADILDLNVGIPEIDETAVLPSSVLAVQAVTDLPLQLDSSSAQALEKAARVYNGIPIINSVSGKDEILDSVLPVMKTYGGMAVALLLDDIGIPAVPKGRLAVADKIISRAQSAGISKQRFLFDALTMTVATDSESGEKTLECVKALSSRGLHTVLGVSNISFGMPNREAINASFLGAAISRGLSAAIINPNSESMKLVLRDGSPSPDFVFEYEFASSSPEKKENGEMSLFDSVFHGLSASAARAAETLLLSEKPLDIINNHLVPALDLLGKGYEEKTLFLPRLLGGAEAAKAAFSVIEKAQSASGGSKASHFTVVMATVKGDIHDIGKNIVSTLLSNYGFDVIDLGKDVPPELILEKAVEANARLVGLSALMTTTVPAMAETVALLHEKIKGVKVMVGGAVLTEEYAKTMGADFYGEDAMASVKYAQTLV